ncbi:MAG: HpcH/HpaI aldolase/citrate lyase family protein [Paracoccus sp. (in: a-proteobacteria)]|nr:HpcH/HpaI aldolase/citrate lyase family protein [Paracoccus sp. (in: a-proteobacteria)]
MSKLPHNPPPAVPATAPRNAFKARLRAGEALHGLWLTIPSPVTVEALSLVGFDWLLFDSEHTPVELASLQTLLQAGATGPSAPVLRPAWNDAVLIKRALDMGAQTLLVPFVQTAGEAAAAVAACLYPPHGIRGVAGGTRASRFGHAPDYFQIANQEICLLVQIETANALARLEEIATVPGVDGVFIGPADLAASMGHLGNSDHAEVQAAIRDAITRLRHLGVPGGILARNGTDARRYLEWGYAFVAGSVDMNLLVGAARDLRDTLRG